ncbi:prolipoprotein diacylglyceryl transferase [Echinimonas agarilytica]|uniref:Phosphatidylglycerol--prolipoprotein diacylglyceryl transferase n=1 Tax=Echinimonas agarilytica TaxID=1215918 RepID=A0AA41W7X5_9GAMM|nr:prolipoprotein diacylglyceryl transferase [Echinimonas agarilytica]MCM2680585.1 prolipoprotein diacylglyceryl transferase [Echinimonas agarilytica]
MLTQALAFPEIDPVLLDLGLIKVRWYGLMYLVGFVAAMWLGNRQARQPNSGWTEQEVSDLLFYGFIGVILGGRFGYVMFYQFSQFADDPLYLFRIWEGGMSFHGGVLGVMAAMAVFARKFHKSYLSVGDFITPLLPIGLGAGRLGNFINGELWGRETDLSFAMIFPQDPLGLARHPSQLYEFALEGVVLFCILWWFKSKPRPAGTVAGLFLLGYGSFRFLVEFAREPDAHLGLLQLGMSMGQWLCLPMIFGGLGLIAYGYSRKTAVGDKA